MYKKTIKYVDYEGNEREEEFCFNISKAELATMELSMDGGMRSLRRATARSWRHSPRSFVKLMA